MAYLADANVWLRSCVLTDPLYPVAVNALQTLRLAGHDIVLVPQCCYEFWVVATRPAAARGEFGMSPTEADVEIQRIASLYPLLPDTLDVFTEWRRLIVHYSVSGVSAHDARLVAAMLAHGVTHLLTFNITDFARYTEITAVHPANV